MPKCSFCHKAATEKFPLESNGLKEQFYCSEECKKDIIEYVEAENKNTMLFLALLLGSVSLLIIASGISSTIGDRYGSWMTFIALAVMGTTLIKFPYCNPMTIQMLGIKGSKALARYSGVVLLIGTFVAFTYHLL